MISDLRCKELHPAPSQVRQQRMEQKFFGWIGSRIDEGIAAAVAAHNRESPAFEILDQPDVVAVGPPGPKGPFATIPAAAVAAGEVKRKSAAGYHDVLP